MTSVSQNQYNLNNCEVNCPETVATYRIVPLIIVNSLASEATVITGYKSLKKP